MGYVGAKKCFVENCNLVGANPMSDPQTWNLNNGLEQLAAAIQSDLHSILNNQRELETHLQHLERRIANLR